MILEKFITFLKKNKGVQSPTIKDLAGIGVKADMLRISQYFEDIRNQLYIIKDSCRIMEDVIDRAIVCFEKGETVEHRKIKDLDYLRLEPYELIKRLPKLKKDILDAKKIFMGDIYR